MSARKLGRFAGLMVVLAALFAGGLGAAEISHHSGAVSTHQSAVQIQDLEIIWQ